MIRLETKRLYLRNYSIEDAADILEYFSDEEVARYEDFDPMTEAEVMELIMAWQDKDYRLVVQRKADQKVIGSIGYLRDEEGEFSLDYDFNPQYAKQGYATEAAGKLIRHIFDVEGIDRLYADCDIQNENSCRLLERLGFERIRQTEGDSFKTDREGRPVLITSCRYLLGKKRYNLDIV